MYYLIFLLRTSTLKISAERVGMSCPSSPTKETMVDPRMTGHKESLKKSVPCFACPSTMSKDSNIIKHHISVTTDPYHVAYFNTQATSRNFKPREPYNADHVLYQPASFGRFPILNHPQCSDCFAHLHAGGRPDLQWGSLGDHFSWLFVGAKASNSDRSAPVAS